MGKPITVLREEARQRITDAVNESGNGLPAFVIVDIVQNILLELQNIERQQLEQDTMRYNESLKQEQSQMEIVE